MSDTIDDADEIVCGETVDHDEEVIYEGDDGVQWRCRRCDTEGWEPADDGQEG